MKISFVRLFSCVALIFTIFVQAAHADVVMENDFDFAISPEINENTIQLYTKILPINKIDKLHREYDIHRQLEVPPQSTIDDSKAAQSYIAVRASFYLPINIDVLKVRAQDPLNTSKFSNLIQLNKCKSYECQGYIQSGLIKNSFALKVGLIKKEQATEDWLQFFDKIENPEFISAVEFSKFEMVFIKGGGFTAFYKVSENLTRVQNYQIFIINKSSYKKASNVPFFNLEKTIHGIVKDIIIDAKISLLQKRQEKPSTSGMYGASLNKISRQPATNNYDKDLYKQQRYQLIDLEGDRALVERAEKVPKNLFKRLFDKQKNSDANDPWIPQNWELEDPLEDSLSTSTIGNLTNTSLSIQGRENPIHVLKFIDMLNQVLKEEAENGLQITEGTPHEWSPEIKKEIQSAVVGLSKHFICLSLGFCSRFMMTEQEQNLHAWLIKQELNSVTLEAIFRQSLKLNKGDVYLTILTIENLLSANWRYKYRETMPVTKRLKSISSGYNYSADKYGTWYHFFGMILYGYVTSNGTIANVVGRFEALGANVLYPGVDKSQKQWFNRIGGYVGAHLRTSVSQKEYQKIVYNTEALAEDYYLNRNEDFRDRLPLESTSTLKVSVKPSFRSEEFVVKITNMSDQNFVNCNLDIMTDLGAGYYSPFKVNFKRSSLESMGSVVYELSGSMPRGVRIFYTNCEEDQTGAAEKKLY